MIAKWSVRYPQWQNTSARCDGIVGIDVDVPDKAVAEQIRQEVIGHFLTLFPTRVGNPPKFLMTFRTPEPFAKLWTDKYRLPGGGDARVEVLANGQQFVAFGIHPKTGEPYRWFNRSPETVPVAELPEVTRDQVVEFLRAVEVILAAQPGWKVDEKAHANYRGARAARAAKGLFRRATDWAKLSAPLQWLRDVLRLRGTLPHSCGAQTRHR